MQGLISKIVAVLLILVVFLPVHAQNDTRVTYIHTDADGTPFAATDEQGNLEWQIEHFPFGAEHSNTEVRRNSNLSFAGKLYDEEIGLSYFGGRWYDPHAGRFTGIDPMPVTTEDWRTFNRYAYGNNNPYKYVDPDGNLPILIPLVIFLAKEGAAEVASRYTGGATDILSLRRMSSKVVKKSFELLKRNKASDTVKVEIKEPYKRPSGATTKAQRESVQNKPCVDCDSLTPKQYVDHKKPLVEEYYETGTIDKDKMRSLEAVQSHCPKCSAKQGGHMSAYSKKKKKEHGL